MRPEFGSISIRGLERCVSPLRFIYLAAWERTAGAVVGGHSSAER